jgi:5-methylcytosine-specific restriction protein B
VQFHPAYAYEDFMQGIRPQERQDGGLSYPVVPGRFLEFCRKARRREGRCVLIVDEINRANLSRVFGELMYLLEYRDRNIPLAAGGSLSIPGNVRIIGTMNTADRSIALVDHALRRRFAFLPLYPNYRVLQRYQEQRGFPVKGLIQVLQSLNNQIDDPHYHVGITFFLRDDLGTELEDIWRMEIEPYLEEYFFDQRGKVQEYRWQKVRDKVTGA